jgi:hypothetical protein
LVEPAAGITRFPIQTEEKVPLAGSQAYLCDYGLTIAIAPTKAAAYTARRRDVLDLFPVEASPGKLLRTVGHRLATAVGGASGPLYGTALIEAGLVTATESIATRDGLDLLQSSSGQDHAQRRE